MGVLILIKPLNSISLEVDGSNLYPGSIGDSVEPKIAFHPSSLTLTASPPLPYAGGGTARREKDALALFPYPHCVAATTLRRWQHYTPSAWAAAPVVGVDALGRHLAGGRCRLARALPLQERSPLQATALAAGDSAPCGLAMGAAYARRRRPYRRQPCPRAAAHTGGCPCKGLWPVTPLQGALDAAGCPLHPA
ncbi:hypothetical protein BHM03_00021939 [Ensete ventricosum]|nr:hypothetical protein BHM03_00021939 [Ensete ventricosum]